MGHDSPWTFPLFPESASTSAAAVDHVYIGLVLVTGFFIVLIGVLILRFAIRYRRGSQADRSGRGDAHTLRWEITWTVLPGILALGIFLWAAQVRFTLATPPDDARTIYVVGKQWMWKISHPGGQEEINALHVPTGEPIKLMLRSQDVIHSFFVPAFRLKQDALPGRYTTLWFNATRPGRYHLFCAEYCGTEHSAMQGWVTVMTPADFQQWLSAHSNKPAVPGTPGNDAPLLVNGQGPFFRLGCNACHLPENAVRAPRLDGLYMRDVRLDNGAHVIADENYLRESILYPNAKIVAGYPSPSLMPTYNGMASEDDLLALIEFIKSIQQGWPKESTP